jgi:hypothetical protein
MTTLVRIVIGTLLLILGRKLFWVFVGAVGFLVGFNLATRYLAGQPDWVILLIALFVGFLGAGLAVVLQRVAVVVAGFFAGGYLALEMIALLGLGSSEFSWVPFIFGGIAGALLLSIFFDWALILLSSLAGASLVAQALPQLVAINQNAVTLIFVALVVVGCLIQAGLMRQEEPELAT